MEDGTSDNRSRRQIHGEVISWSPNRWGMGLLRHLVWARSSSPLWRWGPSGWPRVKRRWRSRPNPCIIPAGGRSSRNRGMRSSNDCSKRSPLTYGRGGGTGTGRGGRDIGRGGEKGRTRGLKLCPPRVLSMLGCLEKGGNGVVGRISFL